jgi:ribosomal protein L13E
VYDPNSDHRRKGVYKKDIDNLKTRNSTLQTLIQAILNYPEDEVPGLVRQIRTCESLDDVAENIIAKENGLAEVDGEDDPPYTMTDSQSCNRIFENELSGKMGELRLENGSRRFIGGTSNLILLENEDGDDWFSGVANVDQDEQPDAATAIASWTTTTSDVGLIIHLMTMYFTWHYPYFTTLSRSLFYQDFLKGLPPQGSRQKASYCTPLLVNAMLALGCHFTSHPDARAEPGDSATAGDHFFREAKRLILENDEHEKPRLTTVQALALMSVREAGCGREAKGWVYSGMSFRMACDLGLNIDSRSSTLDEQEIDARRITFWGCFLFDK